ncbi:MAG: cbb3-type cytochrome c oxidase subunit I [Ferruginibacter sp.]
MEPSPSNAPVIHRSFYILGMILLAAGLIFGVIAAMQYLLPGFLKEELSFERVRPLHASSVVFWIILAATGGVVTYLQQHTGRALRSLLLARIQFYLFLVAIAAIMVSYFTGVFGGREYWEFPPVLSLPIVVAWILFIINFILSVRSFRRQPVYVWMWFTGLIFFLFTFSESYLWLLPYFRNNVVNDMTIQWKSYGSMVGAWNMLIYGCSIFLMDKISGNKTQSHSNMAFALYFTGLFNLMFNWGHHIYTLPTHAYVKHISYLVSMTELFILGKIIWQWRSALTAAMKYFHRYEYRFLAAADVWIFLNLLLAILMSIPGINVYTHGTHVTVAHSMGTTIGINSFLLMAVGLDILQERRRLSLTSRSLITPAYWALNTGLLVFWISLIGAGVEKARWQMNKVQEPFAEMMDALHPYFIALFFAGVLLAFSFLVLIYLILRNHAKGFAAGQP